MSGFFGVASKEDCVFDLFFGTDYHSHLGTRRAGLAVYDYERGFDHAIHKIENAPFRTKFTTESTSMKGNLGIGCISDFESQPMFMRSHHGTFAIATVSKINNLDELANEIIGNGSHFMQMHNGEINPPELIAALISQKENLIDGIRYAQERIDGSASIMILTPLGIYVARDRLGRTPVVIGAKEEGYCACFESFAYLNLGYKDYKELGPGEIVIMTADSVKTLALPGKDKKVCAFLWVYYGYPASSYEGKNVEVVRYNCGRLLAGRDADTVKPDYVAGIPDSGIAHALGYANASGIPYARPFVKYTPTWARSFMPPYQTKRNLVAKMKLIPINELMKDKSLLLIDDSIVRGTQLGETAEFLYECGVKEIHIRLGCPPILHSCKYLNFSRSNSEMELIARKIIFTLEGGVPSDEVLAEYADPDSTRYQNMIDGICKKLGFTSLRYHRLDDLITAIGLDESEICTYCWNGK